MSEPPSRFTIPLFDLNYDEAEEEAVVQTLRSRWISMGPKTTELEAEFRRMIGVSHALAVSSCTSALHLAMRVLDVGPGDEVIVPSLTFVATANAIRYVGAVPVFADITSPNDLNLNPLDVAARMSSRTKAILVMHYGGFPCDMDAIGNIAAGRNVAVVEDACHGPLSRLGEKCLGAIGDIGCFSFFSNKNISTGEGGMFVTRHAEHYERAKLLRSHGMTSPSYERAKGHATSYDVVDLGYNYRLDDIHSSLALVQLGKLQKDLERRSQVRATYLSLLEGNQKLIIPFQGHKGFASNYVFPVVLKDAGAGRRENVRQKMESAGIQTSVHYPAVHRFSIYQSKKWNLPVTEYVADNVITLPMYGGLTREQIARVVDELTKAVA